MRTALLKASAGSALIRITRRSRFFQSWRAWKALSVQAVAMRRLNRVCRRWVRSIYGSFDWWRRVVVDAAAAEEARKRAARLFGQALQRWSFKSRSGAFVFWKLVATEARAADELHGRSLRLLDQALGGWLGSRWRVRYCTGDALSNSRIKDTTPWSRSVA